MHAARLRAFLDGDASTLDEVERGFFERILEQAKDKTEWVEVSGETLLRGGAVLANAAWGTYSGWTGRRFSALQLSSPCCGAAQ